MLLPSRPLMIAFGSLMLLFSANASATPVSDHSSIEFIGFSNDGRSLAYEQYGVSPGSGFAYSEIFIVDVAANAYRISSKVMAKDERETTQTIRARARNRIRSALSRWHIGNNTGQLQATGIELPVPQTSLSGTQRLQFNTQINTQSVQYELVLQGRAVPKSESFCTPQPSRLLELSLRSLTTGIPTSARSNPIFLQQDVRLPQSRVCAFAYQFFRVYTFSKSLAVFLKVIQTGFEGASVRYMVVTAQL